MYSNKGMPIKFGLVGCGAMGSMIANAFDRGEINGCLAGIYDLSLEKAGKLADTLKTHPKVHWSFEGLLRECDFIIEAASQKAVRDYAMKTVSAGKSILIMSVGALLDKKFMGELDANATSAKIYLPSGALAGIDGLVAGACGGIDKVTLTTTKPPLGFVGVEYLESRGVALDSLTRPLVVFEGKAVEAVRLFPSNINVSAIAALASGQDVFVKIIVDPNTDRNTHEICVSGPFGEITTRTSNVPSPSNPKTSYLACLSAVATLKQVTGRVKVGN